MSYAQSSTTSGRERRRYPRRRAPSLVVRFGDGVFRAENWSLGGIMLDGYEGRLSPGALLTIDGLGRSPTDIRPGCIRARVVRADAQAGRLTVDFLDVDTQSFVFLADLADSPGDRLTW